jgi:hypothetical protein
MSGAVPAAMAANGLPSDGSIIGSVAPVAAATDRLSMKWDAGITLLRRAVFANEA